MRIKQNPLVKAMAALMIFVPLYFLATSSSEEKSEKVESKSDSKNSVKPAVTENEAIAALSGYLSTVESEQGILKQKLDSVVTKDDIAKMLSDAQITAPAVNEGALLDKVNQLVTDKTKTLQKQLLEKSAVSPNSVGNADSEIPFGEAFEVNIPSKGSSGNNDDEIHWAYPVGFQLEKDGKSVVDMFGTGDSWGKHAGKFAGNVKASAADTKALLEEELKPIPYATIHGDSSIHGATALTALIGRVERKGKTHDPFRFQVMLSGDTLMANGQTMPGVANAIVSGVGTGDMAFSCVRGKVTSITFNFEDGRIYRQKGSYEEPLAEIGDKWGNPCIRGELISDIEKYIVAQGTVAGLASYADTIAKQQQTLTSSGNSTSLDLTGDAGTLAMGSFASGGLNKTAETLSERYENYYEAIYVPPGEKLSLLFIDDINIDYIPTNRKVSYESNYHNTASLD